MGFGKKEEPSKPMKETTQSTSSPKVESFDQERERERKKEQNRLFLQFVWYLVLYGLGIFAYAAYKLNIHRIFDARH